MSQAIARDENGKWLKGQTGNPNNITGDKRLAALIGAGTRNGEELVDFAIQVLRGEIVSAKVSPDGEIWAIKPTVGERMAALEWLANRFAGKAKETVEHIGDPDRPVAVISQHQAVALPEADLVNLSAILSRAIESVSGDRPGRTIETTATTVPELLPAQPNGAAGAIPSDAEG